MRTIRAILAAAALAVWAAAGAGECGPMVNPVSDVAWNSIFPVSIGGVVNMGTGQFEDPDQISTPACVCSSGSGAYIGINVSFWEPARIIDTVSTPYCFNAIGAQMDNQRDGTLRGKLSRGGGRSAAHQQMHYYQFPAWAVMNMFLDIPCLEDTEFDVAMISEVVPTWQNELLAMVLNPEALLFGNPAAQLACSADAAAAMESLPLNELFWCMGSWGSAYPLSGSITATDYVEANAGLAARSIYMRGRTGLLIDPGVDECTSVRTPVWKKRNYRLQQLRPVRDYMARPIGVTGLLWTHGKNPATAGDNFSWMQFRRVKCCISVW